MATELVIANVTTGINVYAVARRDSDEKVADQTSESYVPMVLDDFSNYAIELAETPVGSRYYVGALPNWMKGVDLNILYYRRLGSVPDSDDTILGADAITSGGTAVPLPPGSALATVEDVEGIIDFDPSITNLAPFIIAAHSLVEEVCVPASYGNARLRLIETWLAAHFLAVRDPRYASESMTGASASVQGQTAMNLSLTTYGQQAMLLDTNGGLARLNANVQRGGKPVIGITWLGQSRRFAE